MKVVRTVLADNDLLDIWLYIAQDNTTAADRLLERLEQRCERISLLVLLEPIRKPQMSVRVMKVQTRCRKAKYA
jgi:plasmid stabilization system protein ParE